jgi:excisionase family DNA binding protein
MTDQVLEPAVLRPAEVARMLQCSRSQIYRMAAAGTIPAVYLGRSVRIPRKQLVEWIANQAQGRVA